MDLELNITPHDQYIHVQVRGMGSYENAVYMWKSVVEACEQHQCFKVLGDQYLFDSVSTAEAFDHPALFKKLGISKKYIFAWVDNNPRTRETTEFVRNVLANRSIGYGRVFTDLDTARAWLLSQG